MLFCLFLLSRSLPVVEVGEKITYVEKDLFEGETLTVKGLYPNLLIVFRNSTGISINYWEASGIGEVPKKMGTINAFAGHIFSDYAFLNLTNTLHAETSISFTAVTVPNACKGRVWFSNIPSSTFNIKTAATSAVKFTVNTSTCIVFGIKESFDVTLNMSLSTEDSLHYITSGDNAFTGVINNEVIPVSGGYFKLSLGEGAATRQLSLSANVTGLSAPTIPGSGFIQEETAADSSNNKIVITVVVCAVLVVVIAVASFFLLKRKRGGSAGYQEVETLKA